MYRDDSDISSLVIKCFGITNTSVQNFAIRISSVKTVPKCIDVSSLLMPSLRTMVIFQKYSGNHGISSQIHLCVVISGQPVISLVLLHSFVQKWLG